MKKIWKYLAAFGVPIVIFLLASWLNNFVPLGKNRLLIYDAYSQYPGIFMQLKDFNLFTTTAGLGLNFFGTLTYYLMSPFNLLILFFERIDFNTFYVLIIYLKIGLSGLSMFHFLKSQNKLHDKFALGLAIAYSLCGFSSAYYYNTMWFDALYLLPLILLGIDKLVLKQKNILFIVTLSMTIIINYYIGFMLCIFSVLYLIYKLSTLKKVDYKLTLKKFGIAVLFIGAISAIVLIPSFYALMQGKASLYGADFINYLGVNSNIINLPDGLSVASTGFSSHSYGPAQVYSSILTVVLVVLMFFNKKISKKEKITVLVILGFFLLSFSFNLFDYAWQFFQRPIWWQHRYSFTFSAFLIILAYRNIINIDGLKINIKQKVTTGFVMSLIFIISFICGFNPSDYYSHLSLFFICLSIFLVLDYFLFIEHKNFHIFIVILLIAEVAINTFMNLKINNTSSTYTFEKSITSTYKNAVDKIKKSDNSIYRMEFIEGHTSNDGMLYNYNGINFFNSVRNQKFVDFAAKYLNIQVNSNSMTILDYFNPYTLSLLNVKYLIYYNMDYFKKVTDNNSNSGFENPYPLSIGFMSSNKLVDLKLTNDYKDNLNKIFNTMINSNYEIYQKVNGNFKADKDYLILYKDGLKNFNLNNEETVIEKPFKLIKKGDSCVFDKEAYLLDIKTYEEIMSNLSNNLLELKTDIKHVYEGTVNVSEDKTLLFLSIPYDKGLKIYVDGKQTEYTEVLDTFIGVELSPGEHEITIDYFPQGLRSGIVISSIGILLFIAYIVIDKKRLK